MQRRKFLQIGITGMAALSHGSLLGCGGDSGSSWDGITGGIGTSDGGGGSDAYVLVNLSIEEALITMVDGTLVYHWAFQDRNKPDTACRSAPGRRRKRKRARLPCQSGPFLC